MKYLRLRKEDYLLNCPPDPWSLLTEEEKLQLAIYHAHQQQEEDLANLEYQITLNKNLREYKAYKKSCRLKRSKPLNKFRFTENILIIFSLCSQCLKLKAPTLQLPLFTPVSQFLCLVGHLINIIKLSF